MYDLKVQHNIKFCIFFVIFLNDPQKFLSLFLVIHFRLELKQQIMDLQQLVI